MESRRPPPGLIHYSDRGVQYASRRYRERLAEAGVRGSMSRTGNPYDNAVLGEALAPRLREALPSGSLNPLTGSLSGLQFAVALLLSLLVFGNYGTGDRRHDPRRLFGASALAAALPLWVSVWTRGLPPVLFQYSTTVVLVWLGLLVERLSIDRIVRKVELSEVLSIGV